MTVAQFVCVYESYASSNGIASKAVEETRGCIQCRRRRVPRMQRHRPLTPKLGWRCSAHQPFAKYAMMTAECLGHTLFRASGSLVEPFLAIEPMNYTAGSMIAWLVGARGIYVPDVFVILITFNSSSNTCLRSSFTA